MTNQQISDLLSNLAFWIFIAGMLWFAINRDDFDDRGW